MKGAAYLLICLWFPGTPDPGTAGSVATQRFGTEPRCAAVRDAILDAAHGRRLEAWCAPILPEANGHE